MDPHLFIFTCLALSAAGSFCLVCAYQLGKTQGWKEGRRERAERASAMLTLKAGETFLGVVDTARGPYLFTGTDPPQSSEDEDSDTLLLVHMDSSALLVQRPSSTGLSMKRGVTNLPRPTLAVVRHAIQQVRHAAQALTLPSKASSRCTVSFPLIRPITHLSHSSGKS
jgi:hypothetical protein